MMIEEEPSLFACTRCGRLVMLNDAGDPFDPWDSTSRAFFCPPLPGDESLWHRIPGATVDASTKEGAR